MNDNGARALMNGKAKLGGDASIAAGPVGPCATLVVAFSVAPRLTCLPLAIPVSLPLSMSFSPRFLTKRRLQALPPCTEATRVQLAFQPQGSTTWE
jgi:hypothetical protein